MATPLVRPLRVQGGTFYTFTSSALDISKTFSDDNFRFTFSKFAALDVPTVRQPQNNDNAISWQAIGNSTNTGSDWDPTVLEDLQDGVQQNNVYLAKAFQNYVLNMETIILNEANSDGDFYDNTLKQTVTERLFWKWMVNIGAIRYQDALPEATDQANLFQEETENTSSSGSNYYRQVVKYLGDIDIVNNVKEGGQAYTEVYLHIPTSHGSTPDVLWNIQNDANYNPTLKWYGTNGDDIEGRTEHVDQRMSVRAYFDDNSDDFYETANSFGVVTNDTIQVATDEAGLNTYNMLRSNMDGAVIDWEDADYKKVTDDPNISILSELNASALAEDFSFNVILVYYDIYDQSNPNDVKRNLYGVLFIDDFLETIAEGATLKKFDKFKPNPVTKLNGNSYGLKLNVKFDTSADNVGVEKVINEYNTFSMDLYSDAMVEMQNALENFQTQSLKIVDLQEQVDNLEKFYFNQATIDELQASIVALETSVANAQIALESPSTLIELINNNTRRINSLAAGELSETLTYDLNPFNGGPGIKIDKSVPDKVIIENIVQSYNNISLCYNSSGYLQYEEGNGVTDPDDPNYAFRNNILNIGPFASYFKNKTPAESVDNDVNINLDDRNYKWKTGKTMRISFADDITLLDGKYINFYTDGNNIFKQGSFKWLVGKLNNTELSNSSPIIEIICVDENKYIFEIDVIK